MDGYKTCFKCGQTKKLDEFYIHKEMKDGHLNKCKSCAKLDVSKRHVLNMKNPSFLEKERERGRNKYKRLNYYGRCSHIKDKGLGSDYKSMNKKLRNAGFDLKGKEVHHWNYNAIYSGFILDKRLHRMLHNNLIYNSDNKVFYFNDDILDTKDKHMNFIRKILDFCEEDFDVVEFEL